MRLDAVFILVSKNDSQLALRSNSQSENVSAQIKLGSDQIGWVSAMKTTMTERFTWDALLSAAWPENSLDFNDCRVRKRTGSQSVVVCIAKYLRGESPQLVL